jgi:hypothetical protein
VWLLDCSPPREGVTAFSSDSWEVVGLVVETGSGSGGKYVNFARGTEVRPRFAVDSAGGDVGAMPVSCAEFGSMVLAAGDVGAARFLLSVVGRGWLGW